MSTHHAQTALRYLEGPMKYQPEETQRAMVHAQLETAAQIERLADAAEQTRKALEETGEAVLAFLREAFPAILAMIGSGGIKFGVSKPFDPSEN